MADQVVPLNEENLPEVPTPQVVILGQIVTRHSGDATATMDLADWEAMTEAEQHAWAAGPDTGSTAEPTSEELEDRG